MARSIRRTMLFWYALILLGVLAGFGTLQYYNLRSSLLRDIDVRVQTQAQTLYAGLDVDMDVQHRRGGRTREEEGERPEVRLPGGPPPRFRDGRPLPPGAVAPPTLPPLPPGAPRPERGREGEERPEIRFQARFDLSDEFLAPYRHRDEDAPYYVVWDPRGNVIVRSPAAPDLPAPPPVGLRGGHDRREFLLRGRHGIRLLAGQTTEGVRRKLGEFLWTLVAAGGGVLLLALGGGWFLAGRALAPVERMTQSASAINAANLAERIDTARTPAELAALARTLNEAFDRLQGAFERQSRFTADASHELRTPLSILLSHAELALKKERSPAEYREALETSQRAATRMKAVVEGLLTLARADAGSLRLRRDPVDLKRAVEEAAAMLRPSADARNVTLETKAEPATVTGDLDRLQEAVLNLATNAIRYNREGGRVEIGLRTEGTSAVLTVADTGIGIPEADRPHIFERFYRVDKARSREVGGSGLGLSITKWIVEAHQGTIAFESRENEGTTFTVRLPIATVPDGTPKSENAKPEPS